MNNILRISPAKSDFTILLIGRIVSSIIVFTAISAATKLLSPDQYGLYSIVIVFQGLSSLFIVNPFGQYVNRHLHGWKIDGSIRSKLAQYSQVVFFASFIGSSLALIWALSEHFSTLKLIGITVCTAVLIIGSTWSASYISYINLLGMRKPSVVVSIIGLLSGLVLSCFLAYSTKSVFGWLAGQIIGQVIASILGRRVFANNVPGFGNSDVKTFLSLEVFKQYIIPLALATLFQWWLTGGYRLALNALWGPAVLGAFAVGYAVAAGIIAAVESLLNQYLFPRLFGSLAHAKKYSHSDIFSELLNLSIPLYIYACSLFMLILPSLMHIAISDAYKGAVFFALIALIVETIKAIANALNIANQINVSTASLVPSYFIASLIWCLVFFALKDSLPGDLVISLSLVTAYTSLLSLVAKFTLRELPFSLDFRLLGYSLLCLFFSCMLAFALYGSQVIFSSGYIIASFIILATSSVFLFKRYLIVYRDAQFLGYSE